jgi:hypothetical protein
VATRTTFSAISIASEPPGANNTRVSPGGANATNRSASSIAGSQVNRRGANESASS